MNQVRMIGGQWKRRVLQFVPVDGLRPTPDRLRETLFNWLMWEINATTQVLDVCAGSGALGFEAVSRGAKQAILIEPHAPQARQLKLNVQLLQPDATQMAHTSIQIIAKTAQQALPLLTNTHSQQFNLVFLDPPYSLNLWCELARLIEPLLAANAKIYVEADRPLEQLQLPQHWQCIKHSKVGSVQAGLFTINALAD